MPGSHRHVHGPRPGRPRDRRGRGARGPLSLPGPLSPRGIPADHTPRQSFDLVVTEVLASLQRQEPPASPPVEVVVEEAPLLPTDWTDAVPTSSINPRGAGHRIVVYRLPITTRARTPEELTLHVVEVLLHRLADAWGISPDDLDPPG